MADINLITYTGSLVSPQYDALMNDAELVYNGIFYGAEVTIKDATTLHISQGVGHIYGREFEILAQDITVGLADSGEINGRVYVHIDLGNVSNPAQLLAQTATELPALIDDPDINVNNGISEMEICTFKASTTTLNTLVDTVRRDIATKDYIDAIAANIEATKNTVKSPLTVTKDGNNISKIQMHANAQKEVMRAYGGDNNGIGLMIGAGGTVVIGGGEFAQNAISNNYDGVADGTIESVYIGGDTNVHIISNANNIADAYDMWLTIAGNLRLPGDLVVLADSRNVSKKYANKFLMSDVLRDLVIAREFSIDNFTIDANSFKDFNINFTIPTGYKVLVGTHGFLIQNATNNGVNRTSCVPTQMWSDTTKFLGTIRNLASSQAKIKLTVKALFIRDI